MDFEYFQAGLPVRCRDKYLPVKTGTFDLDQVYKDMIATAQKRQLESMTMMKYDEKFQIFLMLGIALIICEAMISERKKT